MTKEKNMNLGNLSGNNFYAASNMILELENAKTFCSYFEDSDLHWELVAMIDRLQKRIENKLKKELL